MPLIALSLVSAGVIGFQIVLMRLYAIGQWHHFAFMIISIALLGYGVSGTFLTLLRAPLLKRFQIAWQGFALGFGLSALAGFAVARELVINPFELAWDPRLAASLSLTYLLLMVPFFCAANCVGLAFMRFGDRMGRVYRADLVGSGFGAAGAIGVLFAMPPSDALRLVPVLGFAAAAIAGLGNKTWRDRGLGLVLLAAGVAVALAAPGAWLAPRLSDYKDLSLALRAPGAEVLYQTSSPVGQVTVVRSPEVPFRHAPGLSLASTEMPPVQLGLFVDGNGVSAIPRYQGTRQAASYLDWTIAALPYHLGSRPHVLMLGAGGGGSLLLARYHGARQIDVVETDPAIVRTLRDRFDTYTGGIFSAAGVKMHVVEPRGFVAATDKRYDLILMAGAGAGIPGMAGLSETYGLTVEAVSSYLEHLGAGGVVSVTQALTLPPRGAPKLVWTVVEALTRSGVADPALHFAAIRTWNMLTLVVSNDPLSDRAIAGMKDFTRERAFDLVYYPGMGSEEANRYNVLDQPYFYQATVKLLGPDRDSFLEHYKFDLRPATDDRPYFFDFMKWRTLPELLRLRRQGAMPLIEWGPIILIVTLIQAGVLSVILIVLPLVVRRRISVSRGHIVVAAYFFALGLAFFFLEISFIQSLTLFLGHPIYAVAVVLAVFLVFAGLGAGLSDRLSQVIARTKAPIRAVEVAVAAIVASAFICLAMLPVLMTGLAAAPVGVKIAGALLVIAPLAFFMGMPFPLGLAYLAARDPALVPWAWGVNGCASVISAVLATLLAVQFGFTTVIIAALGLYVLAGAVWRFPIASAR